MKRSILGIVVGVLLATYSTFSFAARTIDGKVVRIVDGDTIKFSPTTTESKKTKPLSIRLVGIDAPESHFQTKDGWMNQGPYADQASEMLQSLLPNGTEISLLDFDTDKYGRVLGALIKDGQDINLKMVESGLAIPYFICSGAACKESFFEDENVDGYFKACEKARSAGLGIYNPKDPLEEMPFEFRTRTAGRTYQRYVGDYYTKELVEPTDYSKVDLCKRVFFDRKDVAESLGYTLSK